MYLDTLVHSFLGAFVLWYVCTLVLKYYYKY
nr:MAG TPA: hypothetical protein [Caudoviricetes sp.]